MERDPGLAECVFVVPLVRSGDRQTHPPILWRSLQDALVRSFGGITEPETVVRRRDRESASGVWAPGGRDDAVADLGRRYSVTLSPDRVDAVRDLLRKVGNSFGQRAMDLEVAGSSELLEVRPEDGVLDG